MKVLVIGAGGVGTAFARIAARRNSFEKVVMADFDRGRAEEAALSASDRFSGVGVDASDEGAIADLMAAEAVDAVLNAVDPRFVMPIYRAALSCGHHLCGHGHVPFPSASRPTPHHNRGQVG